MVGNAQQAGELAGQAPGRQAAATQAGDSGSRENMERPHKLAIATAGKASIELGAPTHLADGTCDDGLEHGAAVVVQQVDL